MAKVTILGGKLKQAEANFNSAFGALTKIQTSADNASTIAGDEAKIAEDAVKLAQEKAKELRLKEAFYLERLERISEFINSI